MTYWQSGSAQWIQGGKKAYQQNQQQQSRPWKCTVPKCVAATGVLERSSSGVVFLLPGAQRLHRGTAPHQLPGKARRCAGRGCEVPRGTPACCRSCNKSECGWRAVGAQGAGAGSPAEERGCGEGARQQLYFHQRQLSQWRKCAGLDPTEGLEDAPQWQERDEACTHHQQGETGRGLDGRRGVDRTE